MAGGATHRARAPRELLGVALDVPTRREDVRNERLGLPEKNEDKRSRSDPHGRRRRRRRREKRKDRRGSAEEVVKPSEIMTRLDEYIPDDDAPCLEDPKSVSQSPTRTTVSVTTKVGHGCGG